MMESDASDLGHSNEGKLPKRDWILLPMLSVLTMIAMAVSTESIARRVFSASETSLHACLILDDTSAGVRGIPNSVCWEKIPENQLTEYRFDCSGYRTGMACGPKPPETYRIVLIGSSIALGDRVPIENSFATLLPRELSRLVERKVELYNEAMAYGFPRNTSLRFDDVLAAQPDLILWVLTSVDVKLASFVFAENTFKRADNTSSSAPRLMESLKNSIKNTIREHGGNPLAGTVAALRHFLYEHKSQNQYIQSYLAIPDGGEGFWDSGAGALRAELNPEWEAHLREFEGYAADVEGMARNAGVPLVAVMVPNRAQAAMISLGEWPEGFNPYSLGHKLRSIITSHGGTFIDILPDFRDIPNPERYYYPIDGHPDADGHVMIAGVLARRLSGGAIPELRAAVQPQAASGKGR
jgi:hypothetical protein